MALLHKDGKHPVNKQKLTVGQKAADKVSTFVGSWKFIIYMSILLFLWILANTLMIIYRWDIYPFILLNLILSCLAAYQAPLILMSQNRAAEREIQNMQKDLDEIKKLLKKK